MKLRANGIALEVDVRGAAEAEPLLMIMGLGMQLIAWPDQLVDLLVARGFRVIRFDNRDAGLSQGFDERGVPSLVWAMLRHRLGLPIRNAPYSIDDMAADAAGVLEALEVQHAHVCGASMGGMVAQTLAAWHPWRVKSLTLMMTSSGARGLPLPSRDVQRALLQRPDGRGVDAVVRHLQHFFHVVGSPAYRPDPGEFRQRLETAVRRAYRPAGTARQLIAIAAHGDRTPSLARIAAPTLVLHGAADPLVPMAAAHDLHAKIAGSSIDIVDGMGHDLPQPLLARFADAIATNARRAAAAPQPQPEEQAT